MTEPKIPLREAIRLGTLAGPRPFGLQLGLSVVEGLLPLAGIWAMRLLVDAVSVAASAETREAAFEPVLRAVYLAAGIAVVGAAIRAISSYVADRHGRLVTDRCADRMLSRSSSLDLQQLEEPGVLDLMQRAGQEVSARPARIVSDLAAILLSVVTLLSMGALLALADPWLTLIVVVLAVPGVWLRLRHARRMFAWQRETAEAQREIGYLSTVVSSRQAAKDLRAFRLAPRFLDMVRSRRRRLREQALVLSARRARGELVGQVLSNAALFFAYARLGWLAVDSAFATATGTAASVGAGTLAAGSLGVGAFVMYAQAVQRSQSGVRDLLSSLAALSEHRLFLRAFIDFEQLEPTVENAMYPSDSSDESPPSALRFEGVHFAYPNGREVLRGVDFEVSSGEHVALVGRNGSGKSTIVRLLTRLADPTTGRILHGDRSLAKIGTSAWRRRVSVLFQDAVPLDLSVAENIDPLGEGDADSIREAARSAGALDRIERLPAGFEQRLGRRFQGSAELSAGEWRRLLLARALHPGRELLILDEPSAYLDAEASRSLGRELRSTLQGRTLIVIDHRPEAVQFVDRVLVLEQGRIVESGTPTELARSGGAFSKLFGSATSG